jgi:hypothetical protein
LEAQLHAQRSALPRDPKLFSVLACRRHRSYNSVRVLTIQRTDASDPHGLTESRGGTAGTRSSMCAARCSFSSTAASKQGPRVGME